MNLVTISARLESRQIKTHNLWRRQIKTHTQIYWFEHILQNKYKPLKNFSRFWKLTANKDLTWNLFRISWQFFIFLNRHLFYLFRFIYCKGHFFPLNFRSDNSKAVERKLKLVWEGENGILFIPFVCLFACIITITTTCTKKMEDPACNRIIIMALVTISTHNI